MDYLQAIEAEQERRNTELATLRAALAASEQKREQAESERDQWKAHHDYQIRLKERTRLWITKHNQKKMEGLLAEVNWYKSKFCVDHRGEVDESWTHHGCPVCDAAKERQYFIDAEYKVALLKPELLAAQNDARRLREALTHTLSKIKAATKSMHAMPYIFKLPLFIEDALAAEPTSETKL